MNYGGCATNTTMAISLLDAQGAQAVYGRCDNFRGQPMDRPPLAGSAQPVGDFDYDASGAVEPRWSGIHPGGGPGCPCGWESSQPACGQLGVWTCGGQACATTRVDQRQECR